MKNPRNDLSFKFVSSLFSYDEVTGLLFWKSGRSNILAGSIAGTTTKIGYITVSINNARYYAHRIIWLLKTGEWPVETVDHKDLNKSNNVWTNLRLATDCENRANTLARSHNKLGIKGVQKNGNKFASTITFHGKKEYLGSYPTKEEAAAVFRERYEALYGEFSRVTL